MRSHRKALKKAGKNKPKPANIARLWLPASPDQQEDQTSQGDLARLENEGGPISPVLSGKVSHKQASQEVI